MRILHLSDFHLDKNTREESKRLIIEPLLRSIGNYQSQTPFDIVLFTGDLINQGGLSYASIDEAFKDFQEVFIIPILNTLNLSKDRFFFIPGNHDINRGEDSIIMENGLTNSLTTIEAVNSFIKRPEGINRISAFKKYENAFYEGLNIENRITNFQSLFKLTIDGVKIGIACLNSAWRCYDSATDKNKILIGEEQVLSSIDYLKDCPLKIALTHHYFDWLAPFETETIESFIKQNFNLYFTGHNHKVKANHFEDPDGHLFTFSAPGVLTGSIREPQRKYENGFSIIDYNVEEAKIKATFKKLEYPKNEFVLNNSLGKEGIWETIIPHEGEVLRMQKEYGLVKQIRIENAAKLNEHLITYATDTNAPKSIDQIFVMPNILLKREYDTTKEEEYLKELLDILNKESNFIIFGSKESGKTILLDKLLLESINNYKVLKSIPAFITFKDIKNDPVTPIKEFWKIPSDEAKTSLKENQIVLLIDNISFEEEDLPRLRNIAKFLKEYPKVRFIATYLQAYEEEPNINVEISSMFDYESLLIKHFKAKQIKLLIRKWFPNDDKYETPRKLETLTNAFLALNLPRTPFAVSMFLWIIEKQENFKPINNATLIENFIEKLLNKHGKNEELREKFNYNNKLWLLAEIAHEMLINQKENYCLSYGQFTLFIEDYLKKKKFDFSPEAIIKELLDYGIFGQSFVDNEQRVSFRFTCFFEFFLVKKMQNDPNFKNEVLDEKTYLSFVNEIDYFTGLQRGETDLLKILMDRLNNGFAELEAELLKLHKPTDEMFETSESFLSNVDEQEVKKIVKSNRPKEEEIELLVDRRLALSAQEKGISLKEIGNQYQTLTKLLLLSLRVIKNSEEIAEDNLKFESYQNVIKKSISYAKLHKIIFATQLQETDKLQKNKIDELMIVDRFLPLIHQIFLSDNIGTLKLAAVIREKINNDKINDVPEFEKFLSVFIYSDIRAKDHNKVIEAYIKSLSKQYIEDTVFFKLITYYFYRSVDEKTDNFYLNLIADVVIKSKGYKKEQKVEIISTYRKRKADSLQQKKLFDDENLTKME